MKRVMVSRTAQAILVLISVVLLAPTLAMKLQSTQSLEQFHNRVLTPWPETASFTLDPARYFAKVDRWLADRAYPIISAVYFKNNLAYFALHASPAPNVTVGRDGFVFLNGTEADAENDLVTGACTLAADPAIRTRIEAALGRFAAFGRLHGYPIDVVMVPTVPLLYGDRLPRSFPSALRKACAAGPAGRAPLSLIRAPDGLRFVYPFDEMSALRDDPAMFPMGDFHPDGLSVKVVTDTYLRAVGAPEPAWSVMPTSGPSEILADHGVLATFPVYSVTGSGAAQDDTAMSAMLATVQPFYDSPGETAYVYRDPEAPDPRTVLILSDSYGFNQGISFAAAFRTVVQMPTPDRNLPAMLDAIGALVRFERIVLVFNDSNVARLLDTGDMLPSPASD